MAELEKDFDYKDEHFDFIQQAVSLYFNYLLLILDPQQRFRNNFIICNNQKRRGEISQIKMLNPNL